MKSPKLKALFAVAATLSAAASSHSAIITKEISGTDLTAGASWVGGTAPTADDVATWGTPSTASLGGALTMATAQSWSGIDIQNATAALAISGAGALTLGTSGINIAAAGQNLTFTNSVIFSGATSNVTVGTGRTLLLNGVKTFNTGTVTTLNGAGTVEIGASANSTGAGDVVLDSGTLYMNMQGGTHNRTGSTTINGGIVKSLTSLNFFGTGTTYLNGGAIGSGSATRRIWSNAFVVGGDFGVGGTGLSTGAIQLTGNVDFGGASRQVTVTSILELNGTGGNGTLVKQGAGNLVLGAVNLSSLNINLAAGPMVLGGNGTAQIGNLSGVAGTTISTNYNLSTDGLRTLSVNQTVDGTYAGTIGQGSVPRALSLTKGGSANLTLSGTNTYTGTTTVNTGTLTAGSNAAFGTGAVTVNGGTLDLGGFAVANAITLAGGTLQGASGYTGTISGTAGTFHAGTDAAKSYAINAAGVTFTALDGQGTFTGGKVTVTGAYAPGNSPGTQNFGAGLALSGATTLEIAADGSASDLINVTAGGLDLTSGTATLAVTLWGTQDYSGLFWDANHTFTLISADSVSGAFAGIDVTGLGVVAAQGSWATGWNGNNFEATWTATAVPEPSTYGLIGAGALAAAAFVRRRRKHGKIA